jgi:Family of unknown function (DUF5994)
MTISEALTVTTTGAGQGRAALRLHLAGTTLGRGPLDGAWWPQGRDLDTEAAELINNFPAMHGRIERFEYSAPHWGIPDREIDTDQGNVKAEASRRDDAHVVVLTMSTGRTVRLLVLPAGMTETDARLIMHQAASAPDQADALTLPEAPRTLTEGGPSAAPGPTSDERWVDYGDEFWGPAPVPPSESAWRQFSQ